MNNIFKWVGGNFQNVCVIELISASGAIVNTGLTVSLSELEHHNLLITIGHFFGRVSKR